MGASILKLNMDREKLVSLSEKYYADGNYLAALRFTCKEMELYGGGYEAYIRMSDIYENLGLNAYALKWLFFALDNANEEELPDLYEGIAVNYLSLGEEAASAYYYNLLIGVDDTLTKENKMEIASAFAKDRKEKLRFVWPPELADFSRELEKGSRALKNGDLRTAIREFDKVAKGNKDYAEARQMQAVALLLDGKTEEAERACKDILAEKPDDVPTRSTLAAVYLEQGRAEESYAIAKELSKVKASTTDELYKVATVCCENGLDAEAYERFVELEKKMPCDGKMLYFKGVSAYRSGKLAQAEDSFHKLCTLYPDAAVGKYFLRKIHRELAGEETDGEEIAYFYRLPQTERERRCRELVAVGRLPAAEAELLAEDEALRESLEWCFDEMDGMDDDLQYVAIVVAARVRADGFLREKLLDQEVNDLLKIEGIRLLLERNEEEKVGIVLYNVYRSIRLRRIQIGRKKRKKFISAYAHVAAKFSIISPAHGVKIQHAAEKLYRMLEALELLDIAEKEDDIACAIYLLSELTELGRDLTTVAKAFEAYAETVRLLVACANGYTEE